MMNPSKKISTRYSTKTINPKFYGYVNVNSSTEIIGTKSSGIEPSPGYIYAPYILMETKPIMNPCNEISLEKRKFEDFYDCNSL
jgi:hypothetical protein